MLQVILTTILFGCCLSYSFVPPRARDVTTGVAVRPSFMNRRCFLDMKVSKGKSKHSKANTLHTMNQHRKRIAGKPGNKHFLDPNKVFIGNLSYDSTAEDVKDFLKTHLGGLHTIESVKIIYDWKTNKSKGFGFIQFIEPMFATFKVCNIYFIRNFYNFAIYFCTFFSSSQL